MVVVAVVAVVEGTEMESGRVHDVVDFPKAAADNVPPARRETTHPSRAVPLPKENCPMKETAHSELTEARSLSSSVSDVHVSAAD